MAAPLEKREILKRLLQGELTAAAAREQLKVQDGYHFVIDWGKGSYSIALGPRLTEAQVLEATGAASIAEAVTLAFTD